MEHKFIYKTWNLLSLEEQQSYKDEWKDEGITGEPMGFVNTEELHNLFLNLACSPLGKPAPYEIIGTLGLWDGRKKICPITCLCLETAIKECISHRDTQDYEIYEDENGDLYVGAHHHDGVNEYVIRKVEGDKRLPVHFRREIYGCED